MPIDESDHAKVLDAVKRLQNQINDDFTAKQWHLAFTLILVTSAQAGEVSIRECVRLVKKMYKALVSFDR